MAIRKLKSGRFAIELQQHGRRIFRRLPPLATRADALAYETKIRRDLFAAERLGIKPEIDLGAAIQLWLENVAVHQKDAHRAKLRSKQWAQWVKDRTLREAPEVAKEAVKEWTGPTIRPAGSLSAGTVNRRLALLKAVCKWAWQQGMIEENLSGRIRMLPENGAREVYLTPSQVQRLAANAPSRSTAAAIWLLAYTGLRVSEMLSISACGTPATLTVASRQSKSGKPRMVPVPASARSHLRSWLAAPRVSYWALQSDFSVARKKAGLPHVRIHDLRHTCASWLINKGVDLYTVGKILGHSSPMTTARYAHLAQGTLRKAMAKLR